LYYILFNYKNNSNESTHKLGVSYSEDLVNWKRNDSCIDIYNIDSSLVNNLNITYPYIFEFNNSVYLLFIGNINSIVFNFIKINAIELSNKYYFENTHFVY
jgi:hypothetical protein